VIEIVESNEDAVKGLKARQAFEKLEAFIEKFADTEGELTISVLNGEWFMHLEHNGDDEVVPDEIECDGDTFIDAIDNIIEEFNSYESEDE
jgi:hypothetical protein